MSKHAMEHNAAALDAVPKTYEQAVRFLAAAHAALMNQVDIYYVPDPQGQVVRLIEVSDAFPEGCVERPVSPQGMERIVPVFPMGPAKDFPFRSEVAQIKHAEWEQVKEKTLKLNRNWDVSQALKVPDVE